MFKRGVRTGSLPNATIRGYAAEASGNAHMKVLACTQINENNEDGREVIKAFENLRENGVKPSTYIVLAALKACSNLKDIRAGMKIHDYVTQSRSDRDTTVANTLVHMFAKCGSMVEARMVFDRMPHRSVVSWNAVIFGYGENGEADKALELFTRMQDEGFRPSAVTYMAALRACATRAAKEEERQIEGRAVKLEMLRKGIVIHSQVSKSGLDRDEKVATSLIDMYAKCGSMLDARDIFDKLVYRSLVSWNSMIFGYTESGDGQVALQLFARMQDEGWKPDARTYVAALKACSTCAANEEGKEVDGSLVKLICLEKGMAMHSEVTKAEHESNTIVANALVNMYIKCGSLLDARRAFDRTRHRSVVSWNTLMFGYAENGLGELALELIAHMKNDGCTPNALSYIAALKACSDAASREDGREFEGNVLKIQSLEKGRALHSQVAKKGLDGDIKVASTLVDMYAKCGSMKDAWRVFSRMPIHDVISWNALILGYAQSGDGESGLRCFVCMQEEGLMPDALTFVSALKSAGILGSLETGKEIHSEIRSVGFQKELIVSNSLVDFYGKCGSMVDSQEVFDSMLEKDLVTWNALLSGYSQVADAEQVFCVFKKMQEEQIKANGITFLGILKVCSHAGMVDKGKEYFSLMCSDPYRISPSIEHYTCMVDLLGRANQLDDAVRMLKTMPFQPDQTIWTTILGACQKWKNVSVAEEAFKSMVKLDDGDSAAYVLMANTYAAAGLSEEKFEVQAMRQKARALKKPGQSWWTDNAGKIHSFTAGDTTTSHPQSLEIEARLRQVVVKMKEQGYVPDLASALLHNEADDEQRESALCGHSERLAIGCALINSPRVTTIRIAKNLPICEDCHAATAAISKIEKRVIICRDGSRFHTFRDGRCSCGGFW